MMIKTLLLAATAAAAFSGTAMAQTFPPTATPGLPTGNYFTNVQFGSQTDDFYDGELLTLGSIAEITVIAGQEVLLGASVFGSTADFIRFAFSQEEGLTAPPLVDVPVVGGALPTGCVTMSGGFNCTTRVTFNEVGTVNGQIFVDLLASNPDYRENPAGAISGNGALFNYRVTVLSAAAAVPEPATWAMFLMGFGAVGYSMRSRKVGYKAPQTA